MTNRAVAETFGLPYNPRFEKWNWWREIVERQPFRRFSCDRADGPFAISRSQLIAMPQSPRPCRHRHGQRQRLAEDPGGRRRAGRVRRRLRSACDERHRTPELVRDYAAKAAARGLKVHPGGGRRCGPSGRRGRPHTILPVIGIPVPTDLQAAWTRCSPSCKCPATCRWPRWASAAADRATPACWPSRSWPWATRPCSEVLAFKRAGREGGRQGHRARRS